MSADRAASLEAAMTTRQVDELVDHVIGTHSLGRRAARRFIARHLTADTLAHWRVFGAFPVKDTASRRRLFALDASRKGRK